MRFARFIGGTAVAVALVALAGCTSSGSDSSASSTSTKVTEDSPAAAERQRLEDLYYQEKACKVDGEDEYVEYSASSYVDRDRFGVCLTQADVTADGQATDAAIAEVTARANTTANWPQRATTVVDGYCSLYRGSGLPRIQENYTRLLAAFSDLYATGRTYSGDQYPYSFGEAQQWCRIPATDPAEPPTEGKSPNGGDYPVEPPMPSGN